MRHDDSVVFDEALGSPVSDRDPCVVRSATPEASGRIGDLTVAAYHAGGHLDPGSSYESVLRDVDPRIDRTLIAAAGEDVVGAIAAFEHGHPMSELAAEGEWEIRFLAVRPDRWGAGIAGRLVDAAEERAWRAGADATVLYVIDRNARALGFYPRRGYRREPGRDWSPLSADGSPVHLLAFAKDRPRGP